MFTGAAGLSLNASHRLLLGLLQVWPEGIHGMQLKVEGFSHKLPVLTKAVFEQVSNFKVHADLTHPLPQSVGPQSLW